MIRVFDILLSTIALMVAAVPMLVISLAIYSFDGGTVIFRQTRIGRGGKPFTIFKFRSMHIGPAEQRSGMVQGDGSEDKRKARAAFQTTKVGDPRITRPGRFIRKTHLDELPQIFNVLRGDMSLVGVRPDTPAQEADYTPEYWIARHAYRPGMTGPAQVQHTDGGLESRCEWERTWLNCRSLRLYFSILFQTVLKVFKGNSF